MRTQLFLTAGGLAAALLAGPAAPLAAATGHGSGSGDRVDTGLRPLVSYHAEYVPAGATARVRAHYRPGGKTLVKLRVRGLIPNRAYGAHAHQKACHPTDGAAAGGHFQYVQDPVQPSTDPAYANPDNEIWLDFTTDARGEATARALVDWQFPADRRAHSVIVHDHRTRTGPGEAGVAGPRHGCLTVPF
ncbi:superoxide dismutase family protein [Streptomyces sp. NPDC012888]|uniref:superoxide dismutase family protein n=1 Tax=Streptomyces sp. NPDC012888 TaxID=3364855 RepID=UPI0036AE9FD8